MKLLKFGQALLIVATTACAGNPGTTDSYRMVLTKQSTLPHEVYESSGIALYRGLLWSFNDSGNDPELFGIDTTSWKIAIRITLTHGTNNDWEDLAQDDRYFYIGDFGNNFGNRRNLCIYRLAKDAIGEVAKQTLSADSLTFRYSDQYNFSEAPYATAFDCEAMYCLGDSLYLVTKDWVSRKGMLYRLPKAPGQYVALPTAGIQLEGLITGADYNPQTRELVVCGSDDFTPFVRCYEQFRIQKNTLAPIHELLLPSLYRVQIEGIVLLENRILLSCEESELPQSIFEVVMQ